MRRFPFLHIDLPDWIDELCPTGHVYPDLTDRMGLAIDLARRNVAAGTGGPFGAGVFDPASGEVVAVGVNMVVPGRAAILHAETIALGLAGQVHGTFDLNGLELVSSVEPCAMCLGAVPWSGVSRLVCGARHEDAGAIGFDEGDKPDEWQLGLVNRGIEVVLDVRRTEAIAVLTAYVEAGGVVYNGRGREQ
jgi:tRNA(Arg) A34 adenosine deaminase TadA